jgi:hypothetical protein
MEKREKKKGEKDEDPKGTITTTTTTTTIIIIIIIITITVLNIIPTKVKEINQQQQYKECRPPFRKMIDQERFSFF